MAVQIARLIGGAGTGKTTELLRVMDGALEQLGGNPMLLGFASMTRAARAEAVKRAALKWRIPEMKLSSEGWFRTVHSTVYRCLGVSKGQIIADGKADIEWISNALGVSLSTMLNDESGQQGYIGDPDVAASLNCWALARATMQPLESLIRAKRRTDDTVPDYAFVIRTVERYEMAKRLDDRCDFSDLLARFAGVAHSPGEAVHDTEPEGELPAVEAWMFDEQQDASPLLDAVCRRLITAPSVRWCYVVGDPFQSVYGFAGSSSECFLSWDAQKTRTMPKSYRCPAPILELGEKCLRRMKRGYFDRGIAPADHPGTVTECSGLEELISRINPADEWMLLARTNYHAGRIYAAMMDAHKPVRWTSQQESMTGRASGLAALMELERGNAISGTDWGHAIQILPHKNSKKETMLVRGYKTRWSREDLALQWDVVFPTELESVGATAGLAEMIQSGSWCGLVDGGIGWREMARRWGPELAGTPRARVGTIHSAKGAEADNVGLLTTTSKRVELGGQDDEQHDEECRIAYVGVTRARRNLCIVIEGGHSGIPRMEIL